MGKVNEVGQAPGESADIALDVRGRYALPMGAWYVDELSVSPRESKEA